ncbi:MAG: 2-octaprenyl-3-methyl-6-methoxy,4-benzoquinol hydroxylase [Gammaproteobacteria bacterium]|nr:2-octaprenyl-3-methyl-6-methoxy,4-benzoquinol hydroxylase [Gammaproteobacteria bacterium]
MGHRTFSAVDRLIGEIDKAIKVLSAPTRSARPLSPVPGGEPALEAAERRESSRLMRVNHSGEIAAQALYQGQALTARDPSVAGAMRQAASEEMDHLAWCEQRLRELNGPTSVLNPLWYAGSFAIGALAGSLGDRASLGFIAETEKQVEVHLRAHMERLPPADRRSRAIVGQMVHDEVAHGSLAASLGADELPFLLRSAMRLTSRVMTGSSYWL